MPKQNKKTDFISQFMNWFSSLGSDKPQINREGGGKDLFSRIMNQISD